MTNFYAEDIDEGPVHTFDSDTHKAYLFRRTKKEFRARCTCGATWTYPARRTLAQMKSIFESHLRYFNRPKMETL